MRMHSVVILHPEINLNKRRGGVRNRAYPDIVALEGFDEGFGHAVALRAFDRRETRLQVQCQSNLNGPVGGEDRAVVREPLHPVGGTEGAEALLHALDIMSRIISPEMPAVVATQPMTSRSWQSSANARRTISPFRQVNSSPSEHQRTFERNVATWPSCARGRRRRVWRASNRPCLRISRKTRVLPVRA